MQENLIRLLNIKKDDIVKNIDNLNYLNEELRKNERDLDYIHDNLNLFQTEDDYDVLKFDNIDKSDFKKLISMLSPEIEEVFEDKNCNYDGIIYIIRGIRQGINLSLTEEQNDVILRFIAALEEKATDLVITIKNLNDAKFELDETDLGVLEKSLSKYNLITTKIENHEYLHELDEIIEAMDFSNVISEDKNNILEFIIRFNSEIYLSKDKQEEVKETTNDLKLSEKVEIQNEVDVELPSELLENDRETVAGKNEFEENKFVSEISNFNYDDIENEVDTIPFSPLNEVNLEPSSDLENEKTSFDETNTVDLEQIIQKIDAKLAELNKENSSNNVDALNDIDNNFNDFNLDNIVEPETKVEEVQDELLREDDNLYEQVEKFDLPVFEEEKFNNEVNVTVNPVDIVRLNEVFDKYDINSEILGELKIENEERLEKIEQILAILENYQVLEELKQNHLNLLREMLLLSDINILNRVFETLKTDFYLDEKDYRHTLSISFSMLKGMFLDTKISNDFLNNVEFFKQNQINLINLFDNYRELLIVETDLLLENYEKIKCYNLKLDNDNVKYLLYVKNIEEKLDYYIETKVKTKGFLGTSEEFDGITYFTNHPYKLNNINREVILKLRYAVLNNQKIYGSKAGILSGEISNSKVNVLSLTDEYLDLYFNNDFNFIDRSELLELINEFKNLKNFDLAVSDVVVSLDSLYKVDDLRYQVNNILISRVKTIRLYNYLLKKGLDKKSALIIALTYNSVITKEEYNMILEAVNKLLGGN